MEAKLLDIETEFNSLETKNISLYMKNIKQINKNLSKIELNLNNLLKTDENSDEDIFDINIDKCLEEYSVLLNTINDDNLSNKTIEELVDLLNKLEQAGKNIESYQNIKNELNIIPVKN
jgi:t-SNARE complex subunit (syntaxin)